MEWGNHRWFNLSTLSRLSDWSHYAPDFERALELDPLSPAKKELEIARR